jgi:hypothetical protein
MLLLSLVSVLLLLFNVRRYLGFFCLFVNFGGGLHVTGSGVDASIIVKCAVVQILFFV